MVMKRYQAKQVISQLEKRKGGYYFLKIDAEIVDQFEHKKKTRFICQLDNKIEFQCGLNHLGDGNFFIILSKRNLEVIGKQLGDLIHFELIQDPNPLGVDMPEVLEVLLDQDELLSERFEKLTPGKKRSIIHQINRIKDIDRKVNRSIELINKANLPRGL